MKHTGMAVLISTMPSALRAEPITFAFVGLALLQGAIAYVGGTLMSNALGGARIDDAHSWIREAVAELEAFVSAELKRQLDQKVMEQMQANLQGIITDLNHYASLSKDAQRTNRFLIEASDVSTARLVPLSYNYDQAVFVTTVAMAYRLFSLNALFELDNDPGHIKSARPMMDDYIKKSIGTRERIATQMTPTAHLSGRCQKRNNHSTVCFLYQDGGTVMTWPPEPSPRSMSSVNAQIAARSIPYQQRQDEFVKTLNASIWLSIDCYNRMCQKVGDSYAGPSGAPSGPQTGSTVTGPLTMPGAVVNRILR